MVRQYVFFSFWNFQKLCFWHLLCSLQKVQEGISCSSWCSWLEPIGKRCISVMHMTSTGFYHNITAHFLQRNSLGSKILQNTYITQKFWIYVHVICFARMITAVSSHTHGCDVNCWYINGRETHIFFHTHFNLHNLSYWHVQGFYCWAM
jgi:hypothetical protein